MTGDGELNVIATFFFAALCLYFFKRKWYPLVIIPLAISYYFNGLWNLWCFSSFVILFFIRKTHFAAYWIFYSYINCHTPYGMATSGIFYFKCGIDTFCENASS